MENQRQQISFDEMRVTHEGGFFLHQAASWASFISIVGFITLGLLAAVYLIGAIILSGTDSYMMAQNPAMGAYSPAMIFSWGVFFAVLVICAIGAIPYVYQFNFASRVKKAFVQKDMQVLAQAFRALKNYYVFTGIILIITLILMILGFASMFWLLTV